MSASILPPQDEHLTTGWEPDLPDEDTLLRQAVLVHASWPTALAAAAGRPWRSGPTWAGGWIGDRGAFTNPVVLTRPLARPEEVLADIGTLLPSHVPYMLVSAWPTADLRPYGLGLVGHPPLMVRFPGPGPDSPRPGIEVHEVRDAEELAVAERILVDGYPLPDLEPLAPGDLLDPTLLQPSTRVWVAWSDEKPAAVAAAHHHAGVTLVEFVATLPAARGRGAGAAVTWAATLSDPTRPAVLIASDDGRPVYERMGYLAIERWTAWLRPEQQAG
ncbi:N-acetyltransferase [Pseudonocardia sp. DSM 110487]|uniref:GNAT family N-acetyltransferase n=1 Tax=Pseudonocardia sp. DSM 110487 TaxID=2865833 RepID=UPI001C6962EC|nr:GNAT family N-acetyltransferase [Pseudonocardia sp. DSM 110487]QYN39387.1 N-acetyltransferase [Pseudonocardia sp. DSM 110487]